MNAYILNGLDRPSPFYFQIKLEPAGKLHVFVELKAGKGL